MTRFNFFDSNICDSKTGKRAGETKFGEKLKLVSSLEELKNISAQFVIFGIPEDVGIRGNFGKPGASSTWDSFLDSFLNIQVNQYNNPENCVVLGHLNCDDYMAKAERVIQNHANPEEKLGAIAEKIDLEVSNLVSTLIAYGKTPIIIGGGHNNSFGNIKGTFTGLGKPVNILNIDAHTDLRRTNYRHSGNGFSFAKEAGFMNKYAMFGIHKNYTPQYIFDQYNQDENVKIWLFEDLLLKTQDQELNEYDRAMSFLENEFGLEIDCDAIENFSSSAMTPSGFSINAIRRFIMQTKTRQVHYLHLTEAAAKDNPQIGKALSYFVSDFMRL